MQQNVEQKHIQQSIPRNPYSLNGFYKRRKVSPIRKLILSTVIFWLFQNKLKMCF